MYFYHRKDQEDFYILLNHKDIQVNITHQKTLMVVISHLFLFLLLLILFPHISYSYVYYLLYI